MISVPVPKDLSVIKTKVIWNLTKRQLICFGAAAICGIPLYILLKDVIGVEISALIMVAVMLPFFFLAMYTRDGMPAEKFLYLLIRQKYLLPGKRPYKSLNPKEIKARRLLMEKELKKLEGKKEKNAKDKARIRELSKHLSGKYEKIPDSTQKTINFERMYPDGTCRVKKGFYTRMVEFYDLNYVMLDEDERAEVLGLYSRLLNYFDAGVKFQLFLFNRQVNEKTLVSRFEIPGQGDNFDDIRDEFSKMLKKQGAKGTNGVIKSKFLIFGVEANNISEARRTLNSIEAGVCKNFKSVGANARSLSGKERMEIIFEYFHQDTMEPFSFSYEKMKETGDTPRDFVAPRRFDFSDSKSFKVGKMLGKSHYISFVAAELKDDLLKEILDIDANITVSMHMQTIGPVEAQKMVRRSLSEVQASKIDEQKKAFRGGYDMDILPQKIEEFEKGTKDILKELTSSNQKLIIMTFLVTTFGRTKKELEDVTQKVSGLVEQSENVLKCLQFQQEQGMMASAPIGIMDIPITRMLTTRSTAVLVPFNTQELFMSGQALYYGINANTNNMILADRKKLRTPNGVILGTPGSGKSFSAKREILGCFLVTRDDILVCDPEGEYYPVVQALGGQVVKLSSNSTDYLNPMDIQLSHANDREALKIKSDFLITLCDAIAGGESGLANDEKGIIDRCISKIYAEYFKNPSPDRMPILEDLYNALLHYEPDEIERELAMDARSKAVRIANSLVLYVHGSQNYFNHRTNVDSNNRIVCFDIRDLGNQLKELGMLVVQDAVWNRVSINRERKVSTRYYCDEFHLLLRDKQTAAYCVEIWKRFRKWGGIPTGLTQNVGDFLRSEEIEGILGNSDFIYLLNQNAKDQMILSDKLGLSARQLAHVTNSEQGCGLILFDNVVIPFIDRYPTNTKTYRIMNTKPEEDSAPEYEAQSYGGY